MFWAPDIKNYLARHSVREFIDFINGITEDSLVVELSHELIKLSYVTSEKQKQLERATRHFKWSLILWAVLLFVCSTVRVFLFN